MKLVSMKTAPSEEAADKGSECCAGEYKEPDYPWGLRLRLEDDQLKALGLASLPPVGAPMELHALARVISVSEEQVDGKAKRCMELQVTDLGLPEPAPRPMVDRLYGPREV